LRVEVVDDFHVIAHESDRHDDHIGDRPLGERHEMIVDVGFQPRLTRRPASGLKRQIELLVPQG
jgi:hypothetical protein